ncbi:polysaccharide deacetylase family protein [Hymenobacter lucidus]|uniref:Polysaccharide deacetylase family protein n=1 Tax=Hymenobacter lucidus TaxID=2880930 RepID=A0ABS8AQC8_9BACT|nr:polysaccharide deacetylase family protein [Hymenobacter lucidus]MCB2408428.1 polysaccharide deacetylase family protein [Hymenobacter lucidus]
MKTVFLLAILLTTSALAAAQPGHASQPRRAIICLTYDDGLPSHLRTVLPQLDSAGLKATFFLNAIQGASTAVGEASPAVAGWTAAALRGHELANHTLFHACPEKLGWPKALAVESYTEERMLAEISTQNALLALLDPRRKTRSFAFPCNNFLLGATDYAGLIRQRGLVRYGRAGGTRASVVTDFWGLDPMKVPSWMVEEGTSVQELVAFAERVRQAGGLGIYQFHGVGAEFFRVSASTHRAFLAYLKAHPDAYWVTTFSEAMDFVTRK